METALTVIVTVGNSFRLDDGVGPYIGKKIRLAMRLKIVDCGISPENIVEEVIRLNPCLIVIIDAADFKGKPGQAKLIDKNNIPETSLTTHSISLRVIAGIFEKETKAKVEFIGIQPKNIGFGEKLSLPVKKTADKMIQLINEGFANA